MHSFLDRSINIVSAFMFLCSEHRKMLQRSKMFYICCRFGLFEAMSAIEMMDPKMDAGMIGNQVNRKVLNFEQAIKVLISFSWNENSIQTEM